MGVTIVSTVWVCTKCGKKLTTGMAIKPGATKGGKCSASSAGTHHYVKA